jgi:hypothetical protein
MLSRRAALSILGGVPLVPLVPQTAEAQTINELAEHFRRDLETSGGRWRMLIDGSSGVVAFSRHPEAETSGRP